MIPRESVEPTGRLLPWDTEFFGFRIGRLNAEHLDDAGLRAARDWVAAERVRCAYFFGDAECATTLACAHTGGYKFVDLRMEFVLELRGEPAVAPREVRPAMVEDLPAIEALCRISHQDTRFFKDSNFPAERARDLYAEWIRRDFRLHHILVVPGTNGQIAGYITCQTEGSPAIGRIGLVAVSETERRRGLGRILLAAALHWFHTRGCPEVRVVTQASNIAAQRVYQTQGFRTAAANATFHLWSPSA
jgi:dTDP-4-amino-4,6-dideoxy-D-galactose acyltransferase